MTASSLSLRGMAWVQLHGSGQNVVSSTQTVSYEIQDTVSAY